MVSDQLSSVANNQGNYNNTHIDKSTNNWFNGNFIIYSISYDIEDNSQNLVFVDFLKREMLDDKKSYGDATLAYLFEIKYISNN